MGACGWQTANAGGTDTAPVWALPAARPAAPLPRKKRHGAADSHGTRPNLYLVALADSGVGKDFPRKVNKRLADRVVLSNNVADQFGSGEGIEGKRSAKIYRAKKTKGA